MEVSGRMTSILVPTLGLCVDGSSGPILIPVSESPRSAPIYSKNKNTGKGLTVPVRREIIML